MKYQQKRRIGEIRRNTYEYHRNHDRSFYTWLKARFYMETASVLVYLLQYTKIHSISLTIIYGLLGLLGGALLAVPRSTTILAAIIIFFTKGILDWADGPLARINNQVSALGQRLDYLCGRIGTISFYLGFGIYIVHSAEILYLLLIAGLLLFDKLDGRARTVDLILFVVLLDTFLI